jgi:hypothetical protein
VTVVSTVDALRYLLSPYPAPHSTYHVSGFAGAYRFELHLLYRYALLVTLPQTYTVGYIHLEAVGKGRDRAAYSQLCEVKNACNDSLDEIGNKEKLYKYLADFMPMTVPIADVQRLKYPVIVRPVGVGAFAGAGIQVVNKFTEIRRQANPAWSWIASEYIQNPLLFTKKKFHLRLYCCTNTYGSVTFLPYTHILTAKFPYDKKKSTQKDIYDSHGASTLKDFVFPDALVGEYTVLEIQRMQNALRDFKENLIDILPFYTRNYPESTGSFEILGCDCMFDTDYKLWLFEINRKIGLSPVKQYTDEYIAWSNACVKFQMSNILEITETKTCCLYRNTAITITPMLPENWLVLTEPMPIPNTIRHTVYLTNTSSIQPNTIYLADTTNILELKKLGITFVSQQEVTDYLSKYSANARRLTYATLGDYGLYFGKLHERLANWSLVAGLDGSFVNYMFIDPTHSMDYRQLYLTKCDLKNYVDAGPLQFLLNKGKLATTLPANVPPTSRNVTQTLIVRPVDKIGFAGNGISVTKSYEQFHAALDLLAGRPYTVNRYVEPLLFEGKKFHLRSYILVTSFGIASYYTTHKLFTALDKYNVHDITNPRVFNTHGTTTDRELYYPDDYSDPILTENIEKVLTKLVELFRGKGKSYKESKWGYQLFGVDTMFDQQKKAWVLEINNSPGLSPVGDVYSAKVIKFNDDLMTWILGELKPVFVTLEG